MEIYLYNGIELGLKVFALLVLEASHLQLAENFH